ncbi:MAG: beta-galactosidase trimerization domain-containing protein, partial [Planctomycetota bacterium]|nr:beta-galactosidase trimerization domain-containing protein [Planctomycetota bacterium]
FEQGTAGWRQYWVRGSAGASIKPDDKLRRYGAKSLSIKIPAENSRFQFSQTLDIEPNTTYRVVFWFYTHATGGKGGSFRIGPSDKAGRHLGYFGYRTLHPTGNIWTEQEVFFKSPPSADKAMFEFNFHGPLEGWLDHVSCQRVDETARKDLKLLYDRGPAVYEELIVPGSEPKTPRMFPYWSYSADRSQYSAMAQRYGHQYDLEAEFEECAKHRLAPLYRMWHQGSPQLAKTHNPPVTYYPACRGKIVQKALKSGAVRCRGNRPSVNSPLMIRAFVESIEADNEMPRKSDRDKRCFYFVFDEMFLSQTHIPAAKDRTSDYWKNADVTVKQKYGFGKFGLPDGSEDTDPLKWIAYLRWQADLSVDTIRQLSEAMRKKCPQAIILGPDEFATFCPVDWERMGQVIDIATGQTLCSAGGARRYNVGYLVKFHRDLTGRPVYPYVQLIKYGRSPSVETLYEWIDQSLRGGGEGLFVGAVEWFDRGLNHPKYAAGRKWQATLDIVDRLQTMGKVRRPDDKTMALHFSSFTQMTRRDAPDQTIVGAAYAMLGPRVKAWFTFTDDFQIERDGVCCNGARWDEFKVVVMPDAKYAGKSLRSAALRLVERGGTLVVTDPEAFSFALDGTDLADFRKQLFGVTRQKAEQQSTLVVDGKTLINPDPRELKLTITDPQATTVLAAFADKSPAIVEHRVGKGRAWYFAFNPNTDATVEDVHWIRLWRTWLKKLEVPLDHDIWRFQIPRKSIATDPADVCLTNNAVRFRRNVGEVSMNIKLPGSYTYEIAPKAGPELFEKHAEGPIPFDQGLLTNRRKMLSAKMNPSGNPTDKKAMGLEKWVIRFGAEETAANAITVDLSEPRDLTRCRLVYSGALPEVTIEASPNAKTWTPLAKIPSNETNNKTVLIAKAALKGKFRFVRFRFAQRKEGSRLTLAEFDIWGR